VARRGDRLLRRPMGLVTLPDRDTALKEFEAARAAFLDAYAAVPDEALAFLWPDHQRTTSELRNNPQGVLAPLLAHTKGEPRADDLAEFGLANLSSMAGVGTAARGSKIDAEFRRSTVGSVASNATTVRSASPQRQASLSPRPFSGVDVDTGHGL